MLHYTVLSIATAVIVALTIAVWYRTRQVAFAIGFAFIYYWTLYGAWFIIASGLGQGRRYKFEYVFYKMFPIYLDDDYLWTIILYTLFIVTAQITILYFARKPARSQTTEPPVWISHPKLIALSGACALVTFVLIYPALFKAMELGIPGYAIVAMMQTDPNPPIRIPLFTLYQLMHEAALASATMGLAIFMSGRGGIRIACEKQPAALLAYTVLAAGMLTLNLMLGNRVTVFFATLSAGLFYLANASRPNKLLLVGGAVLAVIAILLPGIMRNPASARDLAQQDWTEKVQTVVTEMFSEQTESVTAHASMYGSLHKDVSLTYGASVVWLAAAVLPRVIRPEIVAHGYVHYAQGVGAAPGQGFTIHHATGWYLNFGVPGIILGAFIFGYSWARLFNAFHNSVQPSSHGMKVLAAVGFWNFTGYVPLLMRDGPEGYKAVIMEALLLPTMMMAAASLRVVLRANRPTIIPTAAPIEHHRAIAGEALM